MAPEWLALWSDPGAMRSNEERRAHRQQQQHRVMLGRQLAAAARSLSGDAGLEVAVGDAAGARDGDGLKIGLDELEDANLPALRGRIDVRAVFLRFHDPALHARLAPSGASERRLFDLLEAVRCEARGARMFAGVEDNIVAYHTDRLRRSDLLGAHLASLVPLAEALRMVVRDTLLGRGQPSVESSGFWMWDRWLRARTAVPLAALASAQMDQAAYAAAATDFLAAVFAALSGRGDGEVRRAPSRRQGQSGEQPEEGDDGPGTAAPTDADDTDAPLQPGAELFADDAPELPPLLHAGDGDEPAVYAPFTTAHDLVVRAEDLGDPQQLRQARQLLDQRRAQYRREFARLVTQLQRRLMTLQTRAWTFDLEDGLIDASRLDRVVVNPGFADAYKQEEESLFHDTAVTLLIDNSGSMRGKPIETACTVADMLSAALEQCGISVEVLGFTTAGWKGGQSAGDWAKAGRPPQPGRLNDLLHIVYKSADEPLRRARNNLVAMLSSDLLKENVDGEALAWAARRLAPRPEARRVLIVISDGAPVDQATLEANADKRILDRHLRAVIAAIEKAGQIELAAIGIKHDVGDYYRNAVRVEKVEDLGKSLVEMLDRLVAR